MKLTITTLTGEKFDVEVNAEDHMKDIKVSDQGQLINVTEYHSIPGGRAPAYNMAKCSRELYENEEKFT